MSSLLEHDRDVRNLIKSLVFYAYDLDHVLVNPRLQLLSPPEILFFEGCLRVPGFMAMVPRARNVLVHALDRTGEPVRIEVSGWYARILQHEIDHLWGTLYVDRMRSQSFSSLENYNRYWKSKSRNDLEREFGTPEESKT